MKILNPQIDIESFYNKLKTNRESVFFLDYDGTLAPFHRHPEKALPYSGLPSVVEELMDLAGLRLIIVTGRYSKDIIPLLGLSRLPEIWASHGLERLKADGTYEVAEIEPLAEKGLTAAKEILQASSFNGRWEQKPGSLALHWRGMEQTERERIEKVLEPQFTNIAHDAGMALQRFDGGIELRVQVRNKGDAVRTVLSESLSRPSATIYFGDDLTDEDAFAAIKDYGGVSVLVRKDLRATTADIWLQPPEELRDFLIKCIKMIRIRTE